jgi:hypothetical protein
LFDLTLFQLQNSEQIQSNDLSAPVIGAPGAQGPEDDNFDGCISCFILLFCLASSFRPEIIKLHVFFEFGSIFGHDNAPGAPVTPSQNRPRPQCEDSKGN